MEIAHIIKQDSKSRSGTIGGFIRRSSAFDLWTITGFEMILCQACEGLPFDVRTLAVVNFSP